jgi:hypothetical protein
VARKGQGVVLLRCTRSRADGWHDSNKLVVGAVPRITRIAVVNVKKVLTATRNVVGFSSGQARRATAEGHRATAPSIVGEIQVAMRDLGKRGGKRSAIKRWERKHVAK